MLEFSTKLKILSIILVTVMLTPVSSTILPTVLADSNDIKWKTTIIPQLPDNLPSLGDSIAVDSTGGFYFPNSEIGGDGGIVKYDASGKRLFSFGSQSNNTNQFIGIPTAIAVDKNDNVYATGNLLLLKFDPSGKILSSFTINDESTSITNVSDPKAIVIDGNDNIYLSFPIQSRIVKLDSSGKLISSFDPGFSNNPQDSGGFGGNIAVDSAGNVYAIAGYGVKKFDPSGKFLFEFGAAKFDGRSIPSTDEGFFGGPVGIIVDKSDNVYVVDGGNSRVQKFDSTGKFLLSFGTMGNDDGQFSSAWSIGLDGKGSIYVTDAVLKRIEVFSITGFQPDFSSSESTTSSSASTQQTVSVPSWVKNNAKYWAAGQLNDDDFVKGMQYLASNNIIHVSQTSANSQGSQTIPSWIKKNADWWSQGQLSDDDFLKGVQYMVNNGIMKIG